jgi:hypothetical protein
MRILPERRYIEQGTPVIDPVPSTSHVAAAFKSERPSSQPVRYRYI